MENGGHVGGPFILFILLTIWFSIVQKKLFGSQ